MAFLRSIWWVLFFIVKKISQSHSSQSQLVHLYCCNWLLLFGHLTKFPISEYNYVINSYETQNNVAYINLYRKLLKIEPNAIHQLVLIIPVDNVALWIIAALFLVLTKVIEVHNLALMTIAWDDYSLKSTQK